MVLRNNQFELDYLMKLRVFIHIGTSQAQMNTGFIYFSTSSSSGEIALTIYQQAKSKVHITKERNIP